MDRIIFGTGSIFIFKNPKNRSETNLAEDQDIESIDWEFAQKEQQATLNIFKKKEQEEQDRKKQEERFLTSLILIFTIFLVNKRMQEMETRYVQK